MSITPPLDIPEEWMRNLEKMAAKRRLFLPKVWEQLDHILDMSQPRIVAWVLERISITPAIVYWVARSPFIWQNIPERSVNAAIASLLSYSHLPSSDSREQPLPWGKDPQGIGEYMLNKQVRDGVVVNNGERLISRHRCTLIHPELLRNFVLQVRSKNPEKNDWEIMEEILKQIKSKYGRLSMQIQWVSHVEWKMAITWLPVSISERLWITWISVYALLSMNSEFQGEKLSINDFAFSIEVLWVRLEWRKSLHVSLGFRGSTLELSGAPGIYISWDVYRTRTGSPASRSHPRAWVHPLLPYSSDWIQISEHAQDHAQNTHTTYTTAEARYSMIWFDYPTYQKLIERLRSNSLGGTVVDEIERDGVLLETVALSKPVGKVSLLPLSELVRVFPEEIWPYIDTLTQVLADERSKIKDSSLNIEKPWSLESLYDCMRRGSPRHWEDHEINSYLHALNARLWDGSLFRFICRPRSEWVVLWYRLNKGNMERKIPVTNLVRIVTRGKRFCTIYPISYRETLQGGWKPFIGDKHIKSIAGLSASIEYWFPKNVLDIPVFLMQGGESDR